MGFLAVWGLLRGFEHTWIALGLGLAYAVSALGVNMISRGGRSWAIALASLTIVCAVASILPSSSTQGQWWLLCLTTGGLLAFRDTQTIHMLSWMPVRARKAGGSSFLALTAGSLFGVLVLGSTLLLAGLATSTWDQTPLAIALLACVFLLPNQAMRVSSKPLARRVDRVPQVSARMEWLLRLSLMFNAVNFLGRRVVLPIAIVSMATQMGWDKGVLPLLGGLLGLMGVVGMLARLPLTAMGGHTDGERLLSWGARMSLLGWFSIGVGAAFSVHALSWVLLLSGWALLETANRVWGTGYMEALRQCSRSRRLSASRAHRLVLQQFMSYKSMGGAAGCAMAAMLSPQTAPWLICVMALACWAWLERPPTENLKAPYG